MNFTRTVIDESQLPYKFKEFFPYEQSSELYKETFGPYYIGYRNDNVGLIWKNDNYHPSFSYYEEQIWIYDENFPDNNLDLFNLIYLITRDFNMDNAVIYQHKMSYVEENDIIIIGADSLVAKDGTYYFNGKDGETNDIDIISKFIHSI